MTYYHIKLSIGKLGTSNFLKKQDPIIMFNYQLIQKHNVI